MKGIFPAFSRLPILVLAMVLAAVAALAITATQTDPAIKPAKKSPKKTPQAAKKPTAKTPKSGFVRSLRTGADRGGHYRKGKSEGQEGHRADLG